MSFNDTVLCVHIYAYMRGNGATINASSVIINGNMLYEGFFFFSQIEIETFVVKIS